MMRKPDTILDEVHKTRRKLYEATKDMTTSERTTYFNQQAEAIAKQYGFKILASTNDNRAQEIRV
jgi:hypothetical protein